MATSSTLDTDTSSLMSENVMEAQVGRAPGNSNEGQSSESVSRHDSSHNSKLVLTCRYRVPRLKFSTHQQALSQRVVPYNLSWKFSRRGQRTRRRRRLDEVGVRGLHVRSRPSMDACVGWWWILALRKAGQSSASSLGVKHNGHVLAIL